MSALKKKASSPGNNGELTGIFSCVETASLGGKPRHPYKLSRREIESSLRSLLKQAGAPLRA